MHQPNFLLRLILITALLLPSLVNASYQQPSALIVDAKKGIILHEKSANLSRYPASLTKLMTIYLAFEAAELGKFSMNQRLKISKKASKMPRSKLGLKPNSKITLKQAILSLIVKSANDSAVAIAENLSGSEAKFAKKMTQRAKDLGMNNTKFKNASGLFHKHQKTTAYDMAKLAIALKRDFPKYYKMFATKEFRYGGKKYLSSNNVLKNYKHANGLKTGYVKASGYNLITSANHQGKDLIGIVFGGKTAKERDSKMISMLKNQFHKFALASKKMKLKTQKMAKQKLHKNHAKSNS